MASGSVATSVVIPVHNAEVHLAELLSCLAAQNVSEPWEVIVVDNRSTDRSREVALAFTPRLRLRIVPATDRQNPSYARNVGVRAAAGRKLLFADADDQVAPGYVESLARALDHHALVTSRVDSVTLNPEWVQDAHGPPWQADAVGVFFGFLPATGVNVGVRRDLFDEVGGFPEAFSGSEDIAFSWRAYIHGARVHLVPEAVYVYRYRHTLRALFRQAANWGRDSVLLFVTFRGEGMPARTARETYREWIDVTRKLLMASGRRSLAPVVVRLGFCAGRIKGSARYRTVYL